jgi:N-acetylmuramoyl-L-alanine amidase
MSIPVTAPPLEIAITPHGRNRPAITMPSPSFITVHEVGNQSPGADENMHRNFVHNGGGQWNVSFHFVVGPTKAIQLVPLDEVAWHASDGAGPGNYDSIAIETIQIGDFDKTLWHLAWLINEIATNPDRFFHNKPRQWDMSIQRIRQHNFWAPDNKNCPQFIRDRGLWPELMRRVDLWHTAKQPSAGGSAPPQYATPDIPDWLVDDNMLNVEQIKTTPVYPIGIVFTAIRDTPRRQGADPNKAEVGPMLKQGTRFRSTRAFRSRDKTWVLTKNGSRIAADDILPRINISVDGHVSVQF